MKKKKISKIKTFYLPSLRPINNRIWTNLALQLLALSPIRATAMICICSEDLIVVTTWLEIKWWWSMDVIPLAEWSWELLPERISISDIIINIKMDQTSTWTKALEIDIYIRLLNYHLNTEAQEARISET